MMKKLIFLSVCCVMLSEVRAQKTILSEGLDFIFSYTADWAGNAGGGIEKGSGYAGYGVIGFSLNTEASGWWKGGEFVFTLGSTQGCVPSESWLGDFQVADNIEAGNHYLFLQEFYYQQQIAHFNFALGMQDLCTSFAFGSSASLYFNSSFGINPVLSTNYAIPIFPILGWGAVANWEVSQKWNLRVGCFDSPLSWEDNPYNLKWEFTRDKGCMFVGESEWNTSIGEKNGMVKLGCGYQSSLKKPTLYLMADQLLWEKENQGLSAFAILAVSNKAEGTNHLHFAGGLNWKGVFSKEGNDEMGLAFTSACKHYATSLPDLKTTETALEFTYRYDVTECLSIQPNIQYIIHPLGKEIPLENALFMALRLGVEFGK